MFNDAEIPVMCINPMNVVINYWDPPHCINSLPDAGLKSLQ